MHASGILWDLDGTIVDTRSSHWSAWQNVMMEEGYDLTYERFAPTFGLRNDQTLRALWGPQVTDAEIVRIGDAKEARFRELIRSRPLDVLPGALRWLENLRAAGLRQALASMAPRLNLDAIVAALNLGPYFETTVAAEDVERGKPDPQVFLLAAKRIEVSPECCVVVEDSAAGLEAARRAGMRCIGVNRNLAGLEADVLVPALDELPAHAFVRLLNGGWS